MAMKLKTQRQFQELTWGWTRVDVAMVPQDREDEYDVYFMQHFAQSGAIYSRMGTGEGVHVVLERKQLS